MAAALKTFSPVAAYDSPPCRRPRLLSGSRAAGPSAWHAAAAPRTCRDRAPGPALAAARVLPPPAQSSSRFVSAAASASAPGPASGGASPGDAVQRLRALADELRVAVSRALRRPSAIFTFPTFFLRRPAPPSLTLFFPHPPPFLPSPLLLQDSLEGVNVYLLGLMGSGKSTVASLVAPALGYTALDADTVLERAAGATVSALFASEGESGFREAESQVLSELAAFPRSVVATGGGVVTRPHNWGHLHTGVTVWLDGPVELLAKRLVADPATATQRPLLAPAGGGLGGAMTAPEGADHVAVVAAKLAGMLVARRALYAQADVTVSLEAEADAGAGAGGRAAGAEEVAARVLRALGRRLQEGRERRAAEAAEHTRKFNEAVRVGGGGRGESLAP